MAIAFVQNAANGVASSTSLTAGFTSANGAGNWIGVGVRVGSTGRTISVTDSAGNSYASVISRDNSTDVHAGAIFHAMNVAGATNTVTMTITGTAVRLGMTIHEYSGLATASALDVSTGTGAAGTSTQANSGVVTTTQADELLLGVGIGSALNPTWSTRASFDNLVQNNAGRLGGEGRIVAATLSTAAVFGLDAANEWSCFIATFKAAAGGGGAATVAPWLMCLGGVQ